MHTKGADQSSLNPIEPCIVPNAASMRPLRIFLDSNDYSILSDRDRLTPEIQETLDYLLSLVDSGQVKCYFSGSILSEMAPLKADYASAAQGRADVLVRLCGKNALVSQERLFANELAHASGFPARISSVYSEIGEWFPEGAADLLPISPAEHAQALDRVLKEESLNRLQRREAKRRLSKHGKPRGDVMAAMAAQARTQPLDELLRKFPMKPNDARVLSRYVAGDATPEEATSALASSLSDPRWMMEWFSQHHETLTPFIEWTRKPAATMLPTLVLLAEHAKSIRAMDKEIGTNLSHEFLSSVAWRKRQDDLLVSLAMQMSAEFLTTETTSLSVKLVDQNCPGLSVAIRSLCSAWATSTTEKPREPKLSDFPDALHAAYAPYVDIFRADSFMAPHIEKQSSRFPVTIVSKLARIRPAIDSALKRRAANEEVEKGTD